MSTAATPLAVETGELENATDLLERRLRSAPDHVAFLRRTSHGLETVTTSAFCREVRRLAAGLVAEGVAVGEAVVIMAPTRYEWAVAEMAVWYAGGVVVPVYETSAPAQIAVTFDRVKPVLVLAAGAAQLVALKAAGITVPIWTMDSSADDLGSLAEKGTVVRDDVVEGRRQVATLDDLASIMFTSGTAAEHKGVHITHGNLVRQTLNIGHEYNEILHEGDLTIVALPLAHVLARGLQLISLASGVTVLHEGDPAHVLTTFGEVRPTVLVVVPRLLQKVRDVEREAAARSGMSGLFARAEGVAIEWGRLLESRQDDSFAQPNVWLRLRHAVFDWLFYRRLRAHLGGRLRWLLCGAAPLDPSLVRFFWGQGIPVLEGYGLTEATVSVTGNRPGDIRPGTVGRPMPGTTVRISDDGEVLVSGIGVTKGYLEPVEGAWADGYLRTGDLGSLDSSGRLTVHGRLGTALVTTWGKKVAPERWELQVERSSLVTRALMVGDGRPYLSALLLLDQEAVVDWARRHGRPNLASQLKRITGTPEGAIVTDPALLNRLARDVDRANAGVSRAEQVRKILPLIADPSPGGSGIPSALKLHRETFLAAVAQHIDELYASDWRAHEGSYGRDR